MQITFQIFLFPYSAEPSTYKSLILQYNTAQNLLESSKILIIPE